MIGGSQGAKVFSNLIPTIISNFSDSNKENLIVQQVRSIDKESTARIYDNMNVKFIIKEFFDDMYYQLNKADLIISRCGASTLAEIELHRKFSILFPLPSAMDNDQYYNAIEFKKYNPCLIIDEKTSIFEISKRLKKLFLLTKNHIK